MTGKPDVVIVGAGVMGCSAAYWLSKEGHKVLLLEKEGVAFGASGMASAHWLMADRYTYEVLENKILSELACQGSRLHQELARVLPQETGIDIGYREHPTIRLAFSEEDAATMKNQISTLADQESPARWLEGQALWDAEPRLNRNALGGVVCRQGQVMAYRFVLALAEAAEDQGMELRHGEVTGLQSHNGRVTGVHL